ncbi:hypothetical protein V8C26DRAFT_306144 [Trichoderma gracile]
MLQPHGSSIGARRTNHLRTHTTAQVIYTSEPRKKRKQEKERSGIISRRWIVTNVHTATYCWITRRCFIDDYLDGDSATCFLLAFHPTNSNMQRPMPNCCLHSLNACSASPCHPCVITISYPLSCVHLSPLQIWNGWSRVFQESLSVRAFSFLFFSFFPHLVIIISCRLSTYSSLLAPCSFWVIKSKFTVHVLAQVMDGCLIAISCWISLSNLFISLFNLHNVCLFLFLVFPLSSLGERFLVSRRHGMEGRGC